MILKYAKSNFVDVGIQSQVSYVYKLLLFIVQLQCERNKLI